MTSALALAARLVAGVLAAIVLAPDARGQGTATKPPSGTDQSFARFRVVSGGQDRVVSYVGGKNLVTCQRDAGWADLWIRFAERTDGGGEASPHLDMDLCGLGSGGTFTPMDPKAAKCSGGQTWAAWWHAGSATFVSGEASRSCTLSIVRKGEVLTGTFGCQGLANPAGGPALDLVDGSFQCTVQ